MSEWKVRSSDRQVHIYGADPHTPVWSGSTDEAEALAKKLWGAARRERDWYSKRDRRFNIHELAANPKRLDPEVAEDVAVEAALDRKYAWQDMDADYYPDLF